jgi:large subunit ribosomal protein L24
MKRLLRRTEVAKKQLQRKLDAEKAKQSRVRDNQSRQHLVQQEKIRRQIVVDARQFAREDWKMGPLAPRRDVGEWREAFGTANTQLVQKVPLPKPELKRVRKVAPYVWTGDRVVVTDGPSKGIISEVEEQDFESMTVKVRRVNQVCAALLAPPEPATNP